MAPEERRRQLIQAAIPLLAQNGGSMTTAQLAKAAGVAEGTIFRLFDDKQALMDAALRQALEPSRVVREVAAIEPMDDPVQRVSAVADRIRQHFLTALPLMHGALRQERSPHTAAAVGNMFASLLDVVEQLFVDEIAAGRLRGDAQQLSRMLVGMCQSVTWQDYFDSGPNRMETSDFIDVLLNGCRA